MEKLHRKWKGIPVWLIVLALIAVITTVSAAYLMTSNIVEIHVTPHPPAPETLVLGASSVDFELDGSTTLTATCSDVAFVGEVTFKANGATIDTTPAIDGIATLDWTPTEAGTFDVVATAMHP